MYQKVRRLALFLTLSFTSNILFAQSAQLERTDVKALLTQEQRELFQSIPKELQPVNISGQPVLPTMALDSDGAFLVPQRIFPEHDEAAILELLNRNITTAIPDLQASIDVQSFSVVELEEMFRLSEIRVYQSLLVNSGNSDSVAPGQIGGGLGGFGSGPSHLPAEFRAALRADMREWAFDPCNESRSQFSSLLENEMYGLFDQISAGRVTLGKDTLEQRRHLASVAKRFDTDCLKPYGQAVEDNEIDRLVQSRTVIFTIGNVPFCGGVRVSKTRVLTARHCFYESATGRAKKDTSLILLGRGSKNISAYVLDNQYQAEKIRGFSFEGSRIGFESVGFSVEQDFVFVNLANSLSLSDPENHGRLSLSEPPGLYDALTLVGYYAFHNSESLFGIEGNTLRDWRDGLRVTKGSYCRALDTSIKGHCVAHACQSMMLFSGGGLFSRAGGEASTARLLGINTLGGEGSTRACKPYISNLASGHSFVGPQGGIALSSKWIFSR